MDYLLRDTFFCGTPVHVDIDFIFRSMIIKEVPILGKKRKIVFEKKAVSAIELYLLSRLHHYKNIAYHKTTGAAEALFYKIMRYVFENVFEEIDTDEFLTYDDSRILNTISNLEKSKNTNHVLKRLCSMFLKRELPKKLESTRYNTQGMDAEKKKTFLKHKEAENENFYTEKFNNILNSMKDESGDLVSISNNPINIEDFVYTNVNNSKYVYSSHIDAINRLAKKANDYPEKKTDLEFMKDVIFIFDKRAKNNLKLLDITKHSKAVASSNIDAIENSINTYTLQRMKKKYEQERG